MGDAEPQGMLARGLSLLVALGEHPEGATATELSRSVGLPISTVHRLLQTEVELGFVTFAPAHKTYRLGVRVFELANKVSSVMSLAEAARPTMRELSTTTGETVQLAVLSNNRALFIEKVGTPQAVLIRGAVGDSEPLHCTSTGKVLLSQLDGERRAAVLDTLELEAWTGRTTTSRTELEELLETVRAQDYATADEEFDAGVRAVGVAVRDARGRTRAALCVSAPAFRVNRELLLSWLPALREAAHAIGVQLPADAVG